jgi:hypothetical protein
VAGIPSKIQLSIDRGEHANGQSATTCVQEEAAASAKDAAQQRALATQHLHACREMEQRLEQCRKQLGAAVTREERTLARNRDIYSRMRVAWASTKGTPRAPGAVAAAARELRPVEIVGIYEHHKAQADLEMVRVSRDNDDLRADVRRLENELLLIKRDLGGGGIATIEVGFCLCWPLITCLVVVSMVGCVSLTPDF